MTMSIPAWDALGVLPPREEHDPTGLARSPYRASLVDIVDRFASSPERVAIIQGFLAYRAAMHRVGFLDGFQWLDGSFSEDVERVEGRAPRDIDVVSFVHLPAATSAPLADGDELAFDHEAAKDRFLVDGYFVEIDLLPARQVVEQSAYWYSMWSHRRARTWKGFVQVELAPMHDALATVALATRAATLVEQP